MIILEACNDGMLSRGWRLIERKVLLLNSKLTCGLKCL